MSEFLKSIEAFITVLVIGLVVLIGAAMAIHAITDRPEHRLDLTVPPAALLCPDDSGHCRAIP